MAWDYLTTPIGVHPNESAPWLALAAALIEDGELDQADRAYVEAFAAEPTNPQILWDRAQNLLQLSRVEQARQLYRQIAGGAWQPRFQSIQDQSRLQLHAN